MSVSKKDILHYGVYESDEPHTQHSKIQMNLIVWLGIFIQIVGIIPFYISSTSHHFKIIFFVFTIPTIVMYLLFAVAMYHNKYYDVVKWFPIALTVHLTLMEVLHGYTMHDTTMWWLILPPVYYVCKVKRYRFFDIATTFIFAGLTLVTIPFQEFRLFYSINILGFDPSTVQVIRPGDITVRIFLFMIYISTNRFYKTSNVLTALYVVEMDMMVTKLLVKQKQLKVLHAEAQANVNRAESEIEIASKIQLAMLPSNNINSDKSSRFEIHGILKPYSQVAGDYYDYKVDRWGNEWFVIGDVSGHGLHAGLLMLQAQTSFLYEILNVTSDGEPSVVIECINELLYYNLHNRMRSNDFMTMSILKHIGHGKFRCSGPHMDILILQPATKTIVAYPTQDLGVWLGIISGIGNSTHTLEFTISPKDIVILYTDGVIESKDLNTKKMMGMETFKEILINEYHTSDSLETFSVKVLHSIETNYSAGITDDLTILMFRLIEELENETN